MHAAVIVTDIFVDQDSSAILTHDDFFPGADIQLPLWRNFIETTSTSIPVDGDDCQAVAGIVTDLPVGCQQTLFDILR